MAPDGPTYAGQVLQPTYRVRDGAPVVQLWGRLESGEPFVVEDDRERPYFFVPATHRGLVADEPDAELSETSVRSLDGEALIRVTLPVPAAVPPLRDRILARGGAALEADVRFAHRYLIDRGARATIAIEGEPRPRTGGTLAFRNPDVLAADARVDLRVLSLDLETAPDMSHLYSAALCGCGVEEVHLVAGRDVTGAIVHASERALATALLARLIELDPDVLLGWNVVDFDLRVLVQRYAALRVRFGLGREGDVPRFQQDPGFTRRARADLAGRVVLDGIDLVRDALRLPDYRLETVAQHVLGRGKRIDHEVTDAGAEIARMYREDPEALVAYNLEDARLVPEILEAEGLLDLAIERSRLSGMPLDRVGASIASFDRLYLPELRARGFAAPSVAADRKSEAIQGGAVLDGTPGLFRDVAVLDFKSLYPSLIRTFHLDPLAHARAGPGDVEAPNGARFSRREAILPGVIETLMARRAAARERGDTNADQAIKIMMNALFGVLGAGSCRFFDPAVANAITSFGQQTLQWTREAFEERGVAVLYGDTDSVFVQLAPEPDATARAARARSLRADVEQAIHLRVREAYGVEPKLTLELEKIFDRFFLPRVRGGRSGSKKRYAGWTEGRLVLVGLESVRRDWPVLAARLQEGMLSRLFTDEPVAPFVKQVVDEVRAGACDGELVYAKRLRKGTLERYAAGAPPHVQAARKLGARAAGLIRYVITQSGPEPVVVGRPLPADIDRKHYVDKVIRPVAESILAETESSFDEAVGNPVQLNLL